MIAPQGSTSPIVSLSTLSQGSVACPSQLNSFATTQTNSMYLKTLITKSSGKSSITTLFPSPGLSLSPFLKIPQSATSRSTVSMEGSKILQQYPHFSTSSGSSTAASGSKTATAPSTSSNSLTTNVRNIRPKVYVPVSNFAAHSSSPPVQLLAGDLNIASSDNLNTGQTFAPLNVLDSQDFEQRSSLGLSKDQFVSSLGDSKVLDENIISSSIQIQEQDSEQNNLTTEESNIRNINNDENLISLLKHSISNQSSIQSVDSESHQFDPKDIVIQKEENHAINSKITYVFSSRHENELSINQNAKDDNLSPKSTQVTTSDPSKLSSALSPDVQSKQMTNKCDSTSTSTSSSNVSTLPLLDLLKQSKKLPSHPGNNKSLLTSLSGSKSNDLANITPLLKKTLKLQKPRKAKVTNIASKVEKLQNSDDVIESTSENQK